MRNENDPRFNNSGYYDPTAYEAIVTTDYNPKVKRVIKTLQGVAHLAGFEIVGRVVLREKETGEVYK